MTVSHGWYNRRVRDRTALRVMVAGATIRLAYGAATLLAPRWVAGRLAAAEPESVMNLRGFGGQHVAVAVFTLAAARSPRLTAPALKLNAGMDACDALAGALEVRERGAGDSVAVGGVVLPFIGLATWLSSLRALRR